MKLRQTRHCQEKFYRVVKSVPINMVVFSPSLQYHDNVKKFNKTILYSKLSVLYVFILLIFMMFLPHILYGNVMLMSR